MKRLWMLILVIVCVCSSQVLAIYRVDPWGGRKSDRAVQKAGYAFYFCDGTKCFAVHLTEQDYQDLLRRISIYSGKMIEDTIDIVKRDSELAANLLRDFKQYRGIKTIDEVFAVLKRKK